MTEQHSDTSRPSVYEQDGVWHYRASAIGGCINELVLMRKGELGEDKTDYIQQVLDAGNEYESAVRVQVAQKADMSVGVDHEVARLVIDDENVVVGNTDGRLENGFTAGVEIKTLGEDSFRAFVKSGIEKFPEYQWQLSVYMHATGLPFVYAAAPRYREKTPDGWEFHVEPGEVHVLPIITEPPIPLSRIKRKVRRIQTLAEFGIEDLPVCEKAKFCSMVRYHDLIGGNVEAEQGELVQPGDELYDLIVARVEAKRAEDAAAKERKDIDDQLKLLMEGPARLEGLGRLVPVLNKGRESLDRKQLALDLGEEFDKYVSEGSPYTSLRWYEEK